MMKSMAKHSQVALILAFGICLGCHAFNPQMMKPTSHRYNMEKGHLTETKSVARNTEYDCPHPIKNFRVNFNHPQLYVLFDLAPCAQEVFASLVYNIAFATDKSFGGWDQGPLRWICSGNKCNHTMGEAPCATYDFSAKLLAYDTSQLGSTEFLGPVTAPPYQEFAFDIDNKTETTVTVEFGPFQSYCNNNTDFLISCLPIDGGDPVTARCPPEQPFGPFLTTCTVGPLTPCTPYNCSGTFDYPGEEVQYESFQTLGCHLK